MDGSCQTQKEMEEEEEKKKKRRKKKKEKGEEGKMKKKEIARRTKRRRRKKEVEDQEEEVGVTVRSSGRPTLIKPTALRRHAQLDPVWWHKELICHLQCVVDRADP